MAVPQEAPPREPDKSQGLKESDAILKELEKAGAVSSDLKKLLNEARNTINKNKLERIRGDIKKWVTKRIDDWGWKDVDDDSIDQVVAEMAARDKREDLIKSHFPGSDPAKGIHHADAPTTKIPPWFRRAQLLENYVKPEWRAGQIEEAMGLLGKAKIGKDRDDSVSYLAGRGGNPELPYLKENKTGEQASLGDFDPTDLFAGYIRQQMADPKNTYGGVWEYYPAPSNQLPGGDYSDIREMSQMTAGGIRKPAGLPGFITRGEYGAFPEPDTNRPPLFPGPGEYEPFKNRDLDEYPPLRQPWGVEGKPQWRWDIDYKNPNLETHPEYSSKWASTGRLKGLWYQRPSESGLERKLPHKERTDEEKTDRAHKFYESAMREREFMNAAKEADKEWKVRGGMSK